MIASIGGQMGVSYTEEALESLTVAAGGHPFLTRQLCSHAIRGLNLPGNVDVERANSVMQVYLREARNYFAESLWNVDAGGPPLPEATLLKGLAAEQPQLDEALIPPNQSTNSRRVWRLALDHLRDQSLVRLDKEGWKITIPLYRRWIRYNILNLSE
jgi:hypothetical protein